MAHRNIAGALPIQVKSQAEAIDVERMTYAFDPSRQMGKVLRGAKSKTPLPEISTGHLHHSDLRH